MNKKGKKTMAHEDDVKELVNAMHDWYGFTISAKMAEAIATSVPEFVQDVNTCGVDTCVREWFADLVGKHLGLKGHWPLNGDGHEYTVAYFTEFKERAEKAGITLSEDWMKDHL